MTTSSSEELIRRAFAVANYIDTLSGVPPTLKTVPHLIRDLLDELTTAPANLAARDAVIADALAAYSDAGSDDGRILTVIRDILAQSPTDAICARDAEKWDEGAVAEANRWIRKPVNPYRTTQTEGATP